MKVTPALGAVVGHSSDPLSYGLDSVDGDIARCSFIDEESGEAIVKEFPFSEVFDVNLVRRFAHQLKSEMIVVVPLSSD